ncbi:BrxA/BrxB family bacilliredoxin [Bacillus cereus]|nr:BrxA/BrxB family bacilliredoxin [Bacillus cereus]
MVIPMRQELVRSGFEELTTEEAVTEFMENTSGTTLVVVNSVCGCAAGLARPSAGQAVVRAEKLPDHVVTVFAGQDNDATAKMREYFGEFPPSSPSLGLLLGIDVVQLFEGDVFDGGCMEVIIR